MSKFRYVGLDPGLGHPAPGTWRWQLHGRERGGFPTAKAAAEDLAHRLGVPLAAVSKKGCATWKPPSHPNVYWHKSRLGWVLKSGKGGAFFTPAQAVKAAPKAGVKAAAKRPQHGRARRSLYRHVYWHRARKAWTVKCPGLPETHHRTDLEAAETLVEPTGVTSVEDLLRCPLQGTGRRKARRIFQAMLAVYTPLKQMGLPGDLADVGRRRRDPSWKNLRSGERFTALVFRYAPYRDLFLDCVREQTGDWRSETEALAELWHMFAMRAATVDKELLSCWVCNVGRQVGHHLGMLPFLTAVGVLTKVAERRRGVITLGVGGNLYQLSPLGNAQSIVAATQVCAMAKRIAAAISPTPTTADTWFTLLNMNTVERP